MRFGYYVRTTMFLMWAIASISEAQQSPAPSNPSSDPSAAGAPNAPQTVRLIVRLKPRAPAGGGGSPMAVTVATQGVNASDVLSARQIDGSLVSLTVPGNKVNDISKNPNIAAVYVDRLSKPFLQTSVPIIEADVVQNSHITGSGYAVAILDTGVDGTHPALSGKVIKEACFSSNDSSKSSTSLCPDGAEKEIAVGAAVPCATTLADCEHGTHVAGIAVSAAGNFHSKPIIGVAPGATIIAIQVFSRITDPDVCGNGAPSCIESWESDQLLALNYIWSISAATKIAAVNISSGEGGDNTQQCDDDLLKPAIDQLRKDGILTVIAAGNDNYSNALSAPACISSAISVGASNGGDSVATDFSDRAPFMSLVAPGVGIVSTWPSSLGGGYHELEGTSMASPFVAGTIALLRSAYPNATADQIASALTHSAPIVIDPSTEYPYRRLDAKIALANMAHAVAARPENFTPAPPASNSDAITPPQPNIARVIVTTPPGIEKPSDILVNSEKKLMTEEKMISKNQFTVTAPISVINRLKSSMKIQPNRLLKIENTQ